MKWVKSALSVTACNFDRLLLSSQGKAPLRHLVNLDDVGHMAAFLASDLSLNITGDIHYVDCGYEVVD